jgi:hypothetical protein
MIPDSLNGFLQRYFDGKDLNPSNLTRAVEIVNSLIDRYETDEKKSLIDGWLQDPDNYAFQQEKQQYVDLLFSPGTIFEQVINDPLVAQAANNPVPTLTEKLKEASDQLLKMSIDDKIRRLAKQLLEFNYSEYSEIQAQYKNIDNVLIASFLEVPNVQVAYWAFIKRLRMSYLAARKYTLCAHCGKLLARGAAKTS